MHIQHLALTNMRTFRRLDLPLTPGTHLIAGPNASGKSNLLEAIAMLATARSGRAGADVELIARDALADDPLPAARLLAEVQTISEDVTVEVIVSCRDTSTGEATLGERRPTSRRFRINGVAKRASDLVGRLRVVLFSADDLAIIDGSPSQRRRYLDLTISQLDGRYLRALQRYQRVLTQRNTLLRRIQERRARVHELEFWDEELAAAGAILLTGRAHAVRELASRAAEVYAELAPPGEELEVHYRPAVPDELAATLADAKPEDIVAPLVAVFEGRRSQDAAAGMTRRGPHRDDVAFLVGGADASAFASRGQQRTAVLALRLAEVALSRDQTGDPPVLLLDDILSELDAGRRERVLAAAYEVDQVLITTPDEDRPSREELRGARRYHLAEGELSSVE